MNIQERASMSDVLAQALKLAPSERTVLQIPIPEVPQKLSDFLSGATREILVFGTTLAFLHGDNALKVLKRKIAKDKVSIRFVLLDPKALNTYNPLDKRRARGDLDQTYALLFRLQDLGIREGGDVRITRATKMPLMSFVATDPFTENCRVRVEHPSFQVDRTTTVGKEMCWRFLAYYMSFLPGCGRVVSFRVR